MTSRRGTSAIRIARLCGMMERVTDAQTTAGAPRVPKRAWTRASGIYPVVGVATLAAVCAVVALTESMDDALTRILLVVVILAGVAIGLLLSRRTGAEAMHRRVQAARAEWARRHGWHALPDAEADPADVALALPSGWWRDVAARGRLGRAATGEQTVRIETWVLQSLPGSKRHPERREIVRIACETGAERFTVSNVPTIDPLMIAPSWWSGRSARGSEPRWAEQVRSLVTARKGMPFSLSVGSGRVVLLALDDPRPQAAEARVELVRAVARLVASLRR
ncbi:hypothetical protein GCM10027064_07590 [Microbacterium petrolearium]|jgi:hypothetical protein